MREAGFPRRAMRPTPFFGWCLGELPGIALRGPALFLCQRAVCFIPPKDWLACFVSLGFSAPLAVLMALEKSYSGTLCL